MEEATVTIYILLSSYRYVHGSFFLSFFSSFPLMSDVYLYLQQTALGVFRLLFSIPSSRFIYPCCHFTFQLNPVDKLNMFCLFTVCVFRRFYSCGGFFLPLPFYFSFSIAIAIAISISIAIAIAIAIASIYFYFRHLDMLSLYFRYLKMSSYIFVTKTCRLFPFFQLTPCIYIYVFVVVVFF